MAFIFLSKEIQENDGIFFKWNETAKNGNEV
jgi:hypothetical protein